MVDEIGEQAEADLDIVGGAEFGGVVADAAPAPHEHHGDRQKAAERHRIVTGPARQVFGVEPASFGRGRERSHEPRVAGRGRRLELRDDADLDAAPSGAMSATVLRSAATPPSRFASIGLRRS